MLEDRDYMRGDNRFGGSFLLRWSATTVLLIVIAACYLLQNLIPDKNVDKYLSLSVDGLKSGFIWELITFQFLHGGFFHLAFNLLALWSFGRIVESRLGVARYLWVYFLAGTIGGLFQVGLNVLLPTMHGGFLFGASAGVCGVMAVFCRLEPEQLIIPLFIKAKYALLVFVGIAAVFMFIPFGSNISHAAHLGGLLTGIAWVRLGWHHDYSSLPWEGLLARLRNPLQSRQRKQELVRAASIRSRSWRTGGAASEVEIAPDEFISKEVDPILDKISAHGIQSLTERERKILDAARKKMSKR